jgi:calcineurin-like phosphoesterase family protein
MQTKHLYHSFKHWYRGGTIFFYSDPHFSDGDMPSLRKEKYLNDQEQIASINKVLGKKDTIIILGDVGNPEPLKLIKGYKILILGNHDNGASKYKDYVDEVFEGPLMISPKILLTHEPVDFKYAFNIHGHDHNNTKFKDEMHLNVCAEVINYTPVKFKDIIDSGKLGKVPNIHGWVKQKK